MAAGCHDNSIEAVEWACRAEGTEITMKTKGFSLDDSLGFWVYRMHTQWVAALRRAFLAAGYDLTPEQWGVLVRIRENEGMNQSRLGEKAFKDRHNITRIIDLLEGRGFIERRPDDTDRRACRLYLTKSGRAVQEALTSVVLSNYGSALKGLASEDLLTMRRILEHVVSNLEERVQ